MRSEDEIRERINKLKTRLSIVAKHHDKYVELYKKSMSSCKLKDVFYIRSSRYKHKYTELYNIWREMTYYKKALEYVLQEDNQ